MLRSFAFLLLLSSPTDAGEADCALANNAAERFVAASTDAFRSARLASVRVQAILEEAAVDPSVIQATLVAVLNANSDLGQELLQTGLDINMAASAQCATPAE